MAAKRIILDAVNDVLWPIGVELSSVKDLWRPAAWLGTQPPAAICANLTGAPFLKVFSEQNLVAQRPCEFAVVMPSILRPTIIDTIRSIFAQDFVGRVQTLIGIDTAAAGSGILDQIGALRPPNHEVLVLYPGYSTSVQHGGLHPERVGGVLRTVLTYLANSRHVAYVDDDNWWAPNHLSSLKIALAGHEWAYSKRWFVHPKSRRSICVDDFESVGPGSGDFARLGGWVDPNCLAIDKLACEAVLRWWSIPQRNSQKAMDGDRRVFRVLRRYFRGRATNGASAYYTIDENDDRHAARVRRIGEERYKQAGL